jgi:hypothetical protein
MKKVNSILAFMVLLSCSVFAQIMNIHLKDGNIIPVPLKDIVKITYDMENTLEGKKAQLVADPVIGEMVKLAALAQQYYKKPAALGGGGNSFLGWVIPDNLKETSNGIYSVKVEDEKITLTGSSKIPGEDNKPFKIKMVVEKNTIKETTIY